MYKQVTRLKKRFTTRIGEVSVEQLWDLDINVLDELAVSLKMQYNESGKKTSFLVAKSEKDKEIKLMFDVALDVLTTRVEEMEKENKKAEIKEHNQKILKLIKEKQDVDLGNQTVEELEKLLKKE